MAWFGYKLVLKSNFTGDSVEFFVNDETHLSDIIHLLDSSLIDPITFKTWSDFQSLEDHLKPGRYIFEEGMSNRVMVNRLKGGLQSPARLQFHHVNDFAELAGKLAEDLKDDSTAFYRALTNDSLWEAKGVPNEMRLAYIVPNTYEVYWTSSPEDVVNRLLVEYEKFWSSSRRSKAEDLGLSPNEVCVLASIVQKETYMADEMPTVAGLYLNRLNKGIKLQSDPTVKYAWEKAHPGIEPVKRVLFVMLELDDPYNTYVYEGLPPGPLTISESRSIDAVLNPDEHDYIFMCADPDKPGYHAFARTVREHSINRQKFIREQWGG